MDRKINILTIALMDYYYYYTDIATTNGITVFYTIILLHNFFEKQLF